MSRRIERCYLVALTDMEDGKVRSITPAGVYDTLADAEIGKMLEIRKAGDRMAPCSVFMDGFSRCTIDAGNRKRIIEIQERIREERISVKCRRL